MDQEIRRPITQGIDPPSNRPVVAGAQRAGALAGRRLSVVIPVYGGARSVGTLVDELAKGLADLYDLEVVLVNDAGPGGAGRICRGLAESHPWVRFVDLARNFGEHNAVMAGLSYCTGDCAVVMDDDFQNPPQEIAKLVEKLDEGYDVVFSRYETKRHSPLRNLGSRFNNAVASLLLDKPRDLYLSSFKALNRFLIDEIIKYQGPYPYIDGLILRTTQNYATQLVRHDPREEGSSGYTTRKLIRLWLNMFTNFSVLPLRVASFTGFGFAASGFFLAIVFAIEKLNNPDLPAGWASLIVAFLIVSGVQLFAIGVIGEYLGRLFLKDNGTPQFVVRDTVNCRREDGGDRS